MEKIGFIGLGVMGRPMCRLIQGAGYPLVVHNRSPAAVDEFVAAGALPAGSPADVAERCDVVITMLPDTAAVSRVITGPNSLVETLRPGSLVIDMSTIAAGEARRLAAMLQEDGVEFVDAPVSGGQAGAIAGTLSIMCGGTEAAVARATPIFRHMSSRVVHVGPSGAGQLTKACNQIMVALSLLAMAEALALAAKADLDLEKVLEALGGGAARCWALEVRGPEVIRRNFEPGFRSSLHKKDLGMALDAARELGVTLSATAAVDQLYGALVATGRGDLDHSAVALLVEELSNTTIASDVPIGA